MRKNILSIVAVLLSIVAIIISTIALFKVDALKPVHSTENISDVAQQGQTQSAETKHPFDQSLVGDWSGTYKNGRQYVKMKVLEDSTLLIEAQDLERYYLFIGYIENNTTVIERRVQLGRDGYYEGENYVAGYLDEHNPGDGIINYLNHFLKKI